MHFLKNKLHLLLWGLVLVLAAFIRFGAAPFSAGPDVAQFWAFAEAFRLYGLDFYRYADAALDIFPFKYWGYVYPPVWLLILALALLASPNSFASESMVDASWRLAMKTPIILADLAIGILLYRSVPGSKYRKLLFACLWLLNPAVWYNSAVFGQFDALAVAFLLGAIILLERGNDRAAFLCAVLAGMTKQHVLIPVAFMLVACSRQMDWRRLLSNVGLMAGVAAVISVPFLVTGNFASYLHSVVFPAQEPGYQYPVMYTFNAGGAILTYLHDTLGWETAGLMRISAPLLGAAIAAALVWCYFKRISMLRGALIGILLFVLLFYRINYQYLVIVIALALLTAAATSHKSERAVALGLAIFPAGWLWLINVSAWFVYLSPRNDWITPVFDALAMTREGLPDYAYVAFSTALTVLVITYIAGAVFRWREPVSLRKPLTGGGGKTLPITNTTNVSIREKAKALNTEP